MSSLPFGLDPNIGLAYAKYKNDKTGESSAVDFADFLLDFIDSKDEKDRREWLEALFGSSESAQSASPSLFTDASINPLFQEERSDDDIGYFSSIEDEIQFLRIKLLGAFKKRYEEGEANEAIRAAKIAALYAQAESIKAPTRLAGFLV